VLPDGVLTGGRIGITAGRISGILSPEARVSCSEEIDASGRYVLPGAIDAHVHSYSFPGEGFHHATRAAVAGGVTTIIDMPYDSGGPVFSGEALKAKKARIEREAVCDVALLGTVEKQPRLEKIRELAVGGVCGFKVSMFETDKDRFPRIADGDLIEVFRTVSEIGLPIGLHAENDDIIRKALARERSVHPLDPQAHTRSRPRVAESEAVLRAMEFALWTHARLHIYHASHPRIFDLVELFRKQGAVITAETCTHYLTLNADALDRIGAKAKVNPPLRSEEERAGLWRLCGLGQVDLITSDHAPWPMNKKTADSILDSAAGMPGVETLVPLTYSEGVARGLVSILDMTRMLASSPARVFGLHPGKGSIRMGADADLIVLDPDAEGQIDEAKLHSSAGWSPYHNMRVQGKVDRTLIRGKTVFDGTDIVVDSGFGRFVGPA
jgi:allantoinase